MNKKNQLIASILAAALLSGGIMFYAGMKYQQKKSPTERRLESRNFSGSRGGQGRQIMGPGGRGPGEEFMAGEVLSKDDKSVTVKTRDGGSKIIYFTHETPIGKSVSGSSSDLENGKQVMINGKNNPDGSFTANNIQIRPN